MILLSIQKTYLNWWIPDGFPVLLIMPSYICQWLTTVPLKKFCLSGHILTLKFVQVYLILIRSSKEIDGKANGVDPGLIWVYSACSCQYVKSIKKLCNYDPVKIDLGNVWLKELFIKYVYRSTVVPVISFSHFYCLLWESFPIQKWPLFSQFHVFSTYFPNVYDLFSKMFRKR